MTCTSILTRDESTQLLNEGYLTFGSCAEENELRPMRFEFEKVFEKFDVTNEKLFGGGKVERAAMLPAFTDCPALLSLIANPTIIAIAQEGLGTDDIEYTGSILRRTLFDSFIHAPNSKGYVWHSDCFLEGDKATIPDDRIAIWIYLDDVSDDEGATQMLPGSTEIVRANLRAGLDSQAGTEELKALADEDENGVFVTAPAGGGLAFKSFVLHRARPNKSGIARRVVTFDYRVRGTQFVPDGNYQALSDDAQEQVRSAVPEAAHWLF